MITRTINSSQSPRAKAKVDLWRLVADAMENERALDVRYRSNFTTLPPGGSVPNFKVMKQLALREQLGRAYPILIALAPIAVLLAAPWQWLSLLIGAVGRKREAQPVQACWIFATTVSNLVAIDAALDSDQRIATLSRHQIRFNPRAMGAEIGWSGCVSAVHAHLRWLLYALTRTTGMRRDLLLHGRDALALLGLAHLAHHAGHIFITDDHYQRWAHVLSHVASDFRIVQHGFVDDELVLPYAGGGVNCIYLRDFLFRASFERYYAINEHRLFSPAASFAHTPLSGEALFLASSFPSIDEEINLLETVRESCGDIPIIVKFHPVHRYDARREKLAGYANLVYEGLGNPGCKIFVSYGSFMEFDYRPQGIATVSIARSGSIQAAADEIRSFFAPSVSQELIPI